MNRSFSVDFLCSLWYSLNEILMMELTTMSEKEISRFEHEEHRVLELSMEIGQILLESGAEIFRVEDTMRRVCRHFGVDDCSLFVLSNGLFASWGASNSRTFAKVRQTPMKGARLDKVVAVNQLSREISEGKYETIGEVERRVKEIKEMSSLPNLAMYLASAVASASFCALFGGNVRDIVSAFIAGLLVYIFILKLGAPRISKMFTNICGGAISTAVCLIAYHLGLGENLSPMISGAILPLVPGVAFTNGIRDIGDGDYLSGTVRLLDAMWTFLCIAIGVSLVFGLYQRFGGIML